MDKFVPFSSTFSWEIISLSVPDAVFLSLVVFVILRLTCFRKMKFSRTLLCGAFACDHGIVAVLALLPVFPAQFAFSWKNFASEFRGLSLIPFFWSAQMIQNGFSSGSIETVFYNLGGNLLLLMPFGVLVPSIWRTRPIKTILLAVISAFCLELLQFLENVLHIGSHNVSFDDFFLNAFGCILAYLLYLGLRTAVKKA